MPTSNNPLIKRIQFLKAPAFVVLILAGFILEFLVELPFRVVTLAAGKRP